MFIFSLKYNWWRIPQSYNKVRVLMYHSISEHIKKEKHNKWRVKPEDFEKQMNWFYKNNWKSFTITEIIKLDKIPEKSFVITFDDGFEDNFTNAFPILQKYNFKATIYLVPNQKTNHWEEKNTSVLSNLLNNEEIIQREVLDFQLISYDDMLKISDMYIQDINYREKGIVEAIIINLSKLLEKTIASSTRFQGGNEHLHEPAKKVWDRLVINGFAYYDEDIGRYKTI